MKKIFICLLFVMCLFMTGCGNKKIEKVVTLDEFANIISNNEFVVSDNTESYTKKVDYILGARLAVFDDNLQMEMIEYKDGETAKKVQDSQIESFALLKSTGAHEDIDKGENFYKYILISNDRYMVTVKVDNTLVFCKTLLTHKEKVEKVLNELGY